ncbi:MAG: hypothetical protein ACTSWA_01605, partial [Candidatus Thorarchaeota archaeon]
DEDSDELSNLLEYQAGTDPQDSDSENDGMPDGWEVQYLLDPNVNDAADDFDLDGLSNLLEFSFNSYPNDPDSDDDRLNDFQEYALGTNPLESDTDGDSLDDYTEDQVGLDPLYANTAFEIMVAVNGPMILYATTLIFVVIVSLGSYFKRPDILIRNKEYERRITSKYDNIADIDKKLEKTTNDIERRDLELMKATLNREIEQLSKAILLKVSVDEVQKKIAKMSEDEYSQLESDYHERINQEELRRKRMKSRR